jgi:SAM-dependent methyltransferase
VIRLIVAGHLLEGAEHADLERDFRPYDLIRRIERASIRRWMEAHRAYLNGRVLDFGAGTQPYRDLVSGEYFPHEKDEPAPLGSFDAIMCNQVMQFLPDPLHCLRWFSQSLVRGGHLLLTYGTNWDEVEGDDLWRFTKAGMERLLDQAGFEFLEHDRRAEVQYEVFRFPLGYGCLARKR